MNHNRGDCDPIKNRLAEKYPTCPAVNGFVNALAVIAELRPGAFAGAHVDNRGIAWSQSDGADIRSDLSIGQGRPVGINRVAVGGFPDSTAGGADINRIRI